MTYEWDPAKAASNFKKHKVSFEEASTVFLDPLALTFSDPNHSIEEDREITIGSTMKTLLVTVVHCDRRGRIRIISARRATRAELKDYEKRRII